MKDPDTLEEIVPEYHSWNPVVRRLFKTRLRTALEMGDLNRERPLDVLDAGCGEGLFLAQAQAAFPQNSYTGWDVHRGITDLRRPGIQFEKIDLLNESAVPRRNFDRIFVLDVLEHFERLEGVLGTLRRLLKPEGILVTSEPTESWLYRLGRLATKGTLSAQEGPAAGPHHHDAAGVHRQVVAAGFKPAGVRRIPFRPFDLFHLRRYVPAS